MLRIVNTGRARHPVSTGDSDHHPIGRCHTCPAKPFTICAALERGQLQVLSAAETRHKVSAGYGFFDESYPADYVYIIISGAVRMSKILSDGRRQVTGFLTHGDVFGFEYRDQHSYSADALTDVEVCRFEAEEFEAFRQRFHGLEHSLLSRISSDLVQAHEQMLLLGRKTPLEKLASFLLRLRARQSAVSGCGQEVRLPMTRADIADYLGLTIETVSRCFTALRKSGAIELPEPTLVRIKDRVRLQAVAG